MGGPGREPGRRDRSCCLHAGLLASAAAWAQQWFAVVGPDAEPASIMVEVDLDSVHTRGHAGEAIIRASYELPQQHGTQFAFRSFVASAQFDCQRRSISLISAAYFELPHGEGLRVGTDSSGREAGMPESLLKTIPTSALQALLKATCALARTP